MATTTPKDDLPILPFKDTATLEKWLAKNHTTEKGVWMKLAKKDSGIPSVTYAEALDVALCYGWIDGHKLSFDETYFLQRFTPRGPKSIWSKINCEKVNKLIAEGRMKPMGLAAVESAKSDGRWDNAYHSQAKAEMPADLQAALDANPKAKAFYATLNSVNRYAIYFRVQNAKKPETRAKNIAKFIEMLTQGKTIYPQKPAK